MLRMQEGCGCSHDEGGWWGCFGGTSELDTLSLGLVGLRAWQLVGPAGMELCSWWVPLWELWTPRVWSYSMLWRNLWFAGSALAQGPCRWGDGAGRGMGRGDLGSAVKG